MAEVTFTAEADRCLQDIFDYHFQRDPAQAMGVVQSIYEKSQVLSNFPYLG